MTTEKEETDVAGYKPSAGGRQGAERRGSPRVERATLVHLNTPEEWGFQVDLAVGRTINISLGGLRLELRKHYPLPLRSVLGLSLVLDNEVVETKGRVIYLQMLDDERCAIGIQFQDVSASDVEKIRRFIQNKPRESASTHASPHSNPSLP